MNREHPNQPHRRGSHPSETGTRGHRASGSKNPKPDPQSSQPDPGPRPVSLRQQELRALMRGEPMPTKPTEEAPAKPEPAPRLVHLRDAGASRRRVVRGATNRRRPNYWAIAGSVLGVAAAVAGAVYLLTNPRFAIRDISVQGNSAIPAEKVLAQVKSAKGINLFLLPVGKFEKAVLTEPTFSKVEMKREWPNRVRVVVTERQPWASVQLPDGTCCTVDSTLVPFRKTEEPEKGLPRVLLTTEAQSGTAAVTLGKALNAPGLPDVHTCLSWADARKDFPLEMVAIDPTGKLCLNRVGGVQVRLGSRQELDRKLETLDLLLARRPDLRDGSGVEYVNLFAYDAPAIMPKPAAKPGSPVSNPGAPPQTQTPPMGKSPFPVTTFAPSELPSDFRT